jgi:clan AA aspartic protease (TIGR02281 family)
MNQKVTRLIFPLVILLSIQSFAQTVVSMEKEGGVFKVPCSVNSIPMKFIFDTGASTVSISLTEASFLLKSGLLSESEILSKEKFVDATGSISVGTKILLRKIEIGGLVIENVEASIVHNLNAPLLLGQSALSKLGEFSFDPNGGLLTFKQRSNIKDNLDYDAALKYYQEGFAKFRESKSKDDMNKVLHYFSLAIKSYPELSEAYYARAFFSFRYYDTDGTYEMLRHYRDLPDEVVSQIESDYLKAIQTKNLENRCDWMIELCEFYRYFEKFEDMGKLALQHRKEFIYDYRSFFYQGLDLCVQKRYSEALQKLSSYLKFVEKKEPEAVLTKGVCYLNSYLERKDSLDSFWSNLEGAKNSFNEYIKLEPTDGKGFILLAKCHLFSGEYEKAIETLSSKSYALKAYNDDTYQVDFIRGISFYRLKEYDEAIENLLMPEEFYGKKNGAVYFYLGLCYSEKGESKKAIDSYSVVIMEDSSNSLVWYKRGCEKLKIKDLVGARLDIELALKFDPENNLAYDSRGELNFLEKRYSECVADMSEAIKLDPESSNSYLVRGQAWFATGSPDKACLDWRKAMELGAKDASGLIKENCK